MICLICLSDVRKATYSVISVGCGITSNTPEYLLGELLVFTAASNVGAPFEPRKVCTPRTDRS